MAEKLTELFHCMWRKEIIPQEFKGASIIHLYKRKGNSHFPPIHCWEDTVKNLNRLNVHLDQKRLIPESQC